MLLSASTVQAAMGTMDYIIDTVSAVHALAPLIGLLKLNGKLVTLGLPNKPLELPIFPLVLGIPIQQLTFQYVLFFFTSSFKITITKMNIYLFGK